VRGRTNPSFEATRLDTSELANSYAKKWHAALKWFFDYLRNVMIVGLLFFLGVKKALRLVADWHQVVGQRPCAATEITEIAPD
jgi:uncharacterized heparinase superfamily protein